MQETVLHRMPRALAPVELPPEEQARADLYALCARLLLAPPDEALLDALAAADALSAQQPDQPLERAWERLSAGASLLDTGTVRDEFDALFAGIGTPLLNPYGSLYLAGFLMEKPLARLRDDLTALGLARAPGSGELEDHLGALCETMRVLVAGAPGSLRPQPVVRQKRFFEAHLATWYERCLHDIRGAEGASFYRLAADFVQAYLDLEAEAFAFEDATDEGAEGGADEGPGGKANANGSTAAADKLAAGRFEPGNRMEPTR